jgi:hypothetical protein
MTYYDHKVMMACQLGPWKTDHPKRRYRPSLQPALKTRPQKAAPPRISAGWRLAGMFRRRLRT